MFYSVELLSAHRGKFGIIWLAATHVKKNLTRRELNSVDIVSACNEITSCIMGRMKMRFSLYLASQLAFGLCVVYREKTKLVLRDLQELYSRSCFTFQSAPVDLPTLGVKPRLKKRKRDEPTELPELPLADPPSDFGTLQIPDILSLSITQPDPQFMDSQNSVYQARPEDITLVEDNVNLGYANTLTFGEELGPTALDFFQESAFCYDRETEAFPSFMVPDTTNLRAASPPTMRARSDSAMVTSVARPTAIAVSVSEQQPTHQECLMDGVVSAVESAANLPNVKAGQLGETSLIPTDAFELPTEVLPATMEAHQIETPIICTEKPLIPLDLPAQDAISLQPIMQPPSTFSGLRLDSEPVVLLHRIDQTMLFRRHRRGPKVCKLAVDVTTRLSMNDLRWNLEHGEETMVTLDSRLAEPSSRTQTRYLLSRCVPRLFAVPATLGTALSSTLCEFWCKHRRFVEEHLMLVGDDLNDLRPLSPPPSISIHRSRSERLTEEADQSVELRRAEQVTPSMVQSNSLFGASNPMLDITINQPASVTDPSYSAKTPVPDIPITTCVTSETDGVRPTAATPILNVTDHQLLPQAESTTLVPLPEELEEPMRQLCPLESAITVLETAAAPEQLYANAGRVWSRLQELLATSDSNSVDMTDLCPVGISKRDAAIAFAAILALAKRRLIRPAQDEPYGPIIIRYF